MSGESGELTPNLSVLVAEFNAHVIKRVQQLEELDGFFAEALPTVMNLETVNDRLTAVGRPDLIISDSAQMMEISHPSDVPKRCSNFSPNFYFYTGVRQASELGFRNEPVEEPIPATVEEILAARNMPKFRTYEEQEEAQERGDFAVFTDVFLPNHAITPAFIRMLILFPEFTSNLVAEMSLLENRHKYTKFEERLYIAYQLMSRLVDKSDYGVLSDTGDVDHWYLCH